MERGHVLSFRLPSDTPDHILKYLQKLKDAEGRKFSKKLAELLIKGVGAGTDGESISIPLHQTLTKEQKEWLKHEQSETLLRTILYQIITDPTSSIDLKEIPEVAPPEPVPSQEEKGNGLQSVDKLEDYDDLNEFQFDFSAQREMEVVEEIEEDPLGDFFAAMNK